MARLTEEYERLDNKVRFVEAVIRGSMIVSNRKKDELLAQLRKEGYKAFPKVAKVVATEEAEEADDAAAAGDYDYLLSMPIWNLTMEKVGHGSTANICTSSHTCIGAC